MFKRVMIIGLIAISVVLMLGTEAKAQLWNVQFFWGSIDCASLLNGLSKRAAANTLVECKILVTAFTFVCKNNGGNADPSGSHIFQPQGAVVSTLTVASQCTLDKQTGKWHCDQTISDPQLQDALGPLVDPAVFCPNANWTIDVEVVTEMDGKVTVFSCKDAAGNACSPGTPGCACTTPPGIVEDTFCADCFLPGGVPGEYSCTELPLATCPVP